MDVRTNGLRDDEVARAYPQSPWRSHADLPCDGAVRDDSRDLAVGVPGELAAHAPERDAIGAGEGGALMTTVVPDGPEPGEKLPTLGLTRKSAG
jgi:hypothetical protein